MRKSCPGQDLNLYGDHSPEDFKDPVEGANDALTEITGTLFRNGAEPKRTVPATKNATLVRPCNRCGEVREHGPMTKRGRPHHQPYCKPCMVDYHRSWRNGPGKETFVEKNNASKARYPERVAVRQATNWAIKNGTLIRQPCVVCGDPKSEAHHDDYAKPLVVVWVCRTHHRALDRQRREAAA